MGTRITSREFDRDASAAKRAAQLGPVTITDHGRPSHVLLTAEEYDRFAHASEKLGDRLWARGTENIDLELPQRSVEPPRELDL